MLLRWLISAGAFAALKGQALSLARDAGHRMLLVVLLAVVWLTVFVLILVAVTVWLSASVGTAAASAIVAAGLAVAGLGIQLAVSLSSRSQPKADPVAFPSLAGVEMPRIDGASLGYMAAVAAAGYLIGRRLFR